MWAGVSGPEICLVSLTVSFKSSTSHFAPKAYFKSKDSAMLCGVQKAFCVFCMASSRPLNLCLERTSDLGKESTQFIYLENDIFR